MQSDDARTSERTLALVALTLALLMFVFPLAIPLPLLDPDEGLHTSIAQEMIEHGDWLTPRFLGRPFLDKPILCFWTQAASMRWFGFNEAAARFPSLMFGLLGALSTGLLGWRLFNRTTGLIAGILYSTTILPTAMAQVASHDVALIPFINLAILLLWQSNVAVSRWGFFASVFGAGVFLGLAILTKGVVGPAVVAVAFAGSMAATRRFPPKLLVAGLLAAVLGVLIAAPWYGLVEINHPGYLRYFFLKRHVLGLATATQPHSDHPWWYYAPILLGGGLPWIGYLPILFYRGEKTQRCLSDELGATAGLSSSGAQPCTHCLLWSWLLGWTVLMTLAGSKLATYIWPAFPPIALLAATAWAGLIQGTLSEPARRAFQRTFVLSSLGGPIVLPAAVLLVQKMFDVRFGGLVWTVVGIVAVATLLPLLAWRRARWTASLACASLSLAVQFLIVLMLIMPALAPAFTARVLAEHFNDLGRLPPRLWLAEERIGSLVFYLKPALRAELTPERLQRLLIEDLPEFRPGDVIAVPSRKQAMVQGAIPLEGMPYETVGRYRIYCIERQPVSSRSNHFGRGPTFKTSWATTQPTAAPANTSLR